jgi:hypothetical protein
MPKKERDREIRRRRQRQTKLLYLRKRLAEAKDSKTRAMLQQKIIKISPQAKLS